MKHFVYLVYLDGYSTPHEIGIIQTKNRARHVQVIGQSFDKIGDADRYKEQLEEHYGLRPAPVRKNNRGRVFSFTDERLYKNAMEAARFAGVHPNMMYRHLKGEARDVRGNTYAYEQTARAMFIERNLPIPAVLQEDK